MLGFNRWHFFAGLTVIVSVAGICWLALDYFIPAPPATITIASGLTGGNYDRPALRYQRILARSHVNLEMRAGSAGWDNVKLLRHGYSCWRWRSTYSGLRRVWVCGHPYRRYGYPY
jgi:hypothetical protein